MFSPRQKLKSINFLKYFSKEKLPEYEKLENMNSSNKGMPSVLRILALVAVLFGLCGLLLFRFSPTQVELQYGTTRVTEDQFLSLANHTIHNIDNKMRDIGVWLDKTENENHRICERYINVVTSKLKGDNKEAILNVKNITNLCTEAIKANLEDYNEKIADELLGILKQTRDSIEQNVEAVKVCREENLEKVINITLSDVQLKITDCFLNIYNMYSRYETDIIDMVEQVVRFTQQQISDVTQWSRSDMLLGDKAQVCLKMSLRNEELFKKIVDSVRASDLAFHFNEIMEHAIGVLPVDHVIQELKFVGERKLYETLKRVKQIVDYDDYYLGTVFTRDVSKSQDAFNEKLYKHGEKSIFGIPRALNVTLDTYDIVKNDHWNIIKEKNMGVLADVSNAVQSRITSLEPEKAKQYQNATDYTKIEKWMLAKEEHFAYLINTSLWDKLYYKIDDIKREMRKPNSEKSQETGLDIPEVECPEHIAFQMEMREQLQKFFEDRCYAPTFIEYLQCKESKSEKFFSAESPVLHMYEEDIYG